MTVYAQPGHVGAKVEVKARYENRRPGSSTGWTGSWALTASPASPAIRATAPWFSRTGGQGGGTSS